MRRFAFTLSELLITLTIVGVVAVLTVPNVTKNVIAKANITKLEATYKTLNDVINNMMIDERVKDVRDSSLYTDKEYFFEHHVKVIDECENHESCIKKGSTIRDDKNNGMVMRACSSADANESFTIKLPSGAVVNFCPLTFENPSSVGYFYVDVNGIAAPNRYGRDIFTLELFKNGHAGYSPDYDYEITTEKCTESSYYSGFYCFLLLEQNNWVMNY